MGDGHQPGAVPSGHLTHVPGIFHRYGSRNPGGVGLRFPVAIAGNSARLFQTFRRRNRFFRRDLVAGAKIAQG